MWPLCCVGNNLIAVSIRISSQYYIVMPCTEVATSSSSAIITYCPSVIYRSVLDVLYSWTGRDGTVLELELVRRTQRERVHIAQCRQSGRHCCYKYAGV